MTKKVIFVLSGALALGFFVLLGLYAASQLKLTEGKLRALSPLDFLKESNTYLEGLSWIFGDDSAKTVVLLFQNPAEIRPTGGFLGSIGVVETKNGEIQDFKFYNMAELDKQNTLKIIPPRPLRRIASAWFPSDANWFLDFPTSAEKLSFFLENLIEVKSDVVIAVNPSVISEILGLIGPVEMPEYNLTLDQNNFWPEAQIQVRSDTAEGEGKKFLEIFAKSLGEKLQSMPKTQVPLLLKVFLEGLEKKEVQIYARNSAWQKFVEEKGWAGKLPNDSYEDFLAVVNTNIGGEKSDYFMNQNFSLTTSIDKDGVIINSLRLSRTHTGENAPYRWWRARNYDYIRIYVPKGSEFLSGSGGDKEPLFKNTKYDGSWRLDEDIGLLSGSRPIFLDSRKTIEIFEESGKTVFGTWLITDPGETRAVTLVWRLPFRTGFSQPTYRLVLEKQSGTASSFSHAVKLPEGAKVLSGELTLEGLLEKTLTRLISFKLQ